MPPRLGIDSLAMFGRYNYANAEDGLAEHSHPGAQLRRHQQIRAIAARLRGEFRDLAQVFGNRTWLAGRGADGYVYLFLNQIIS